jgi:cytochrome oxidase complex assembly protein 1
MHFLATAPKCVRTDSMTQQFFPTAAPVRPPSWFSRHLGLSIALGCCGLLAAVCLLFAGIFVVVTGAIRSSDPYRLALSAASRDPDVVAALGGPLKPGWLTTGNIQLTGSSGHAELAIPISGPRGAGTLNACAEKSAGKWTFTCLSLAVAGRAPAIELMRSATAP